MAGDETGIGDGGRSDCYGDKVGGQETASRAMLRATDNVRRPGRRGTTTAIVAGAASDVGSERTTRGQDDSTTRGDATTRRRDKTMRGWHSERMTRGRECGVTRRQDDGVTRGDATTSLHD